MQQSDFERYLQAFNTRDYETLHRDFFAPDVELVTLGHVLRGQAGIRKFYDFFHRHIKETIHLIGFYPTPDGFFAHVGMRLEAIAPLTQDMLEAEGVGNIPPLPMGMVFTNEMFIHYHMENGKFRVIRCATYVPPEA